MSASKEKIIATDIDEVLFPFLGEFTRWHNQEYGTTFTLEDFTTYEFEQILQVPVKEVVHRVEVFLHQEHGHLHVEPIHEAQEALATLSEDHDIIAITARHPQFETSTSSYLQHHFGQVISELRLIGHWATVIETVTPKYKICQKLGVSALIDDNLGHVTKCQGTEVQGILFGNYEWNKHEQVPDSVLHCPTWKEVLEYAYSDKS